eukprot:3436883-Pyramimonas_sp.AAC.2
MCYNTDGSRSPDACERPPTTGCQRTRVSSLWLGSAGCFHARHHVFGAAQGPVQGHSKDRNQPRDGGGEQQQEQLATRTGGGAGGPGASTWARSASAPAQEMQQPQQPHCSRGSTVFRTLPNWLQCPTSFAPPQRGDLPL